MAESEDLLFPWPSRKGNFLLWLAPDRLVENVDPLKISERSSAANYGRENERLHLKRV